MYQQAIQEINARTQAFYADNADSISYEDVSRYGQLWRFVNEVQGVIPPLMRIQSDFIIDEILDAYATGYQMMGEAINSNLKPDYRITIPQRAGRYLYQNPIRAISNPFAPGRVTAMVQQNIQTQVTAGIVAGDSYSHMANRLQQTLKFPRNNAVVIARTETARARGVAERECAGQAVNDLKGQLVASKVWRTMQDSRVRHPPDSEADHVAMEGQIRALNDDFDLGNGVYADIPRTSGDAKNDIQCRCIVEMEFVMADEIAI